jgi:hypothetical protein
MKSPTHTYFFSPLDSGKNLKNKPQFILIKLDGYWHFSKSPHTSKKEGKSLFYQKHQEKLFTSPTLAICMKIRFPPGTAEKKSFS